MSTITFAEFQKNPAAIFDLLDKSQEPIRITRKGKKAFVLLPEDETALLLRSTENARRLKEAKDDLAAGRNYHERKLIEE